MRNILFCFYFLLICLNTFGQLDLKFQTISIKNGLSSNSVNDILKDDRGFIWVATDDGLNRYDGKEIRAYHHDDFSPGTVANNTVYCLFNSKVNQLLVGTQSGICEYNPKLDAFENEVLQGVRVKAICQSKSSGEMYFATDQGLFVFSENLDSLRHWHVGNSNLESNDIRDVKEDLNGAIWVAAYEFGAYELLEGDLFKPYTIKSGKLDAHFVQCLAVRRNGDVLLSSYDHGVFRLDRENDVFKELPCSNCTEEYPRVIELYEDNDSTLWIGTDGSGLAHYNDADASYFYYKHSGLVHTSINDDVIHKVYDDNRGGLWVGSYFRGLNFVNLYAAAFTHLEEIKGSSDHNIVSGVLEDKNQNLWLSTDGGGIVHYNKDQEFLESYNTYQVPYIASNSTLQLAFDREDKLWVGTYFGGLQCIETAKQRVTIYNHDDKDSTSIASDVVWCVIRDSKDQIWLGTQEGVSKFDRKSRSFINYTKENTKMLNDNVRVVYEDRRGDYWFGTEDALYRLDNKEELHEYRHVITDRNSICNNWIVTINEDLNGALWLGSYGGGISRYRPETDDFITYDERSGLSNNFICAILPDSNNNLWISTQKGLTFFNQNKELFKRYHEEDGLQGDKFSINSYHKSKDGTLYFGGTNGLTSFIPSEIESNGFAPKLTFTDFKLHNKSINFEETNAVIHQHISTLDQIELPYDYSVFTLQFAALNYIQSNKNQYAYYLKGFDKEWNFTGNKNEATYTNLAPGKYTFLLKGSNNNDIWTAKPISLKIKVLPPFYKTWWFRFLIVSVIVFAFYVVYRLQMNRVTAQKRLLKKTVDDRTRTLHEKSKELEEKNANHLESLEYAKLIQEASLTDLDEVDNVLSDKGVLYMPSHIVSGDFYWMKEIEEKLIIAIVDCTGHGVPGAFMSLVGNVALNNIINWRGIKKANEILEALHAAVVRALRQNQTNNKDGMDMSIVVIDKKKKEMQFSGAMNSIVLVQGGKMNMIKGTRRGIGGTYLFNRKEFENHMIDISNPTTFYLFTDGYQDQFGGMDQGGKKFMARRFRELLKEIHRLPMETQMNVLKDRHKKWKQGYHQTDDILVFGGKVS